jgi:hypothetical protein
MMVGYLASARRQILRSAIAISLVVALSACSSPSVVERYNYMRVTVGNFQTLGISVKDRLVRGVVIYFHDANADEFVLTGNDSNSQLTATLAEAGFAVITGSFGSNKFGDPEMVRSYLELGKVAAAHYQVDNLYLLADSMGAVPAVSLLSGISGVDRVRGLAAIDPVLDLDSVGPEYETAVDRDYVNANPNANPMRLPPESFRGKKIAFFVDKLDQRVATQVNAFKDRIGSDANIDLVTCAGASESTCTQGDELVKWFTRVERRGVS